jgi:putative membrane protein
MRDPETPAPSSAPGNYHASATETVALIGRGFAMGAADVVPGVSGGTVALVLGIYEQLVANIRAGAGALGQLVRLDGRSFIERLRSVQWRFLIPLLSGIGLAVLTLARVISTALDDHPVGMSALFFGLVAGSAIVAWRMLDNADAARVAILVGVAVVAFFVLGLGAGERTEASLLLVLAAGALAICAMILPGVSGSFLLLTIGMYELVIDAVNDRDLAFLAVFMLGCVAGLALFSTALDWALEHHRDTVLAALTGLMVGSLRVLWPWPEGTDEAGLETPGEQWGLALVIAVVAFFFVVVVSEIGQRRTRRKTVEPVRSA